MYIPVDREAFLPLLGASFLIGGCFGVIGDGFVLRRRITASAFRRKRDKNSEGSPRKQPPFLDALLTFTEDILMAIVCAVSLILLSYKWNYGQIRLFSLLAALLGYILYRKTVSPLVLSLVIWICRVFLRVGRFLLGITLLPLLRRLTGWKKQLLHRIIKQNTVCYTKKEEKKILHEISR